MDSILTMLQHISPQARSFVEDSLIHHDVMIHYRDETPRNQAVFLVVTQPTLCVCFAYFENEKKQEPVMQIITDVTLQLLHDHRNKEICFNLYGENEKTIQHIRSLGFKLDIEGVHMQYSHPECLKIDDHPLKEKGYDSDDIQAYCSLFDQAYASLALDNGWDPHVYTKNEDAFDKKLSHLHKHRAMASFWIDAILIGAYLIKDDYITDIVVRPDAQNKGYGQIILAHCINAMRTHPNIQNIRLRVAKNNTSAQRFYEKNHFEVIACFSEHTFPALT